VSNPKTMSQPVLIVTRILTGSGEYELTVRDRHNNTEYTVAIAQRDNGKIADFQMCSDENVRLYS
jgi:hypothetical protein